MPRVSPIQESFGSGYLGNRVRGRVSSDVYSQGLAECLNWYPLVQGPIRMREGSSFVEAVDPLNWVSGMTGVNGLRVFTFQRGLDNDAIIEVGSSDIIVRNTDGTQIIGGVSDNLIPDPDFSQNGVGAGNFDSAIWVGALDLVFGTDPGRTQSQGADNTHAKGVVTIDGQPTNGVSLHSKSEDSPSGWNGVGVENTTAYPINVPAGSELLLNELTFTVYWFQLTGDPKGVQILEPFPLADPFIRIQVGTTQGGNNVLDTTVAIAGYGLNDVSVSFIPGGGNNTLYLRVSNEWTGAVASVPDLITGFGAASQSVALGVYKLDWRAPLSGGSGSAVEFPTPWTEEQMECLQYCMDPGEQVAIFTHPEVETYRLRLATGEWAFEALSAILLPDPFVAPSPNTWASGNFPGACAFHEGRLYLAGSPNEPATIWASRSGDYVDFNGAAPAQPDDPLLFPLSSAGNIQTLTSRKELVINTDISEVVGTSQNGVITFEDFSFPKQTDWGSNCIQPIVIGREMIYTSNSRQRLRSFADEGGTNFGWDGTELSLLAQELFGSPVRRMEFLDEPAYQACFLLTDGTMAMATYFYPENVVGWWKYETSYNGDRDSGDTTQPGLGNQVINAAQTVNQIVDITKINTSQGAQLWMVVNRIGYPGTQKVGHEVLAFETGLPIPLDSFSQRVPYDVFADGEQRIDDVDELTDQSVNVVICRNVPGSMEVTYTIHPNITVIAGVSSPLESWVDGFSTVFAGLFYENEWELLPIEGVSNRGSAQVSKRRWNEIILRLNQSSYPLVNGEYPKDRTPATPMGTGEPIRSTDVVYTELGSLNQGQLVVTQDRSIIAEVVAIFGKVISSEV